MPSPVTSLPRKFVPPLSCIENLCLQFGCWCMPPNLQLKSFSCGHPSCCCSLTIPNYPWRWKEVVHSVSQPCNCSHPLCFSPKMTAWENRGIPLSSLLIYSFLVETTSILLPDPFLFQSIGHSSKLLTLRYLHKLCLH